MIQKPPIFLLRSLVVWGGLGLILLGCSKKPEEIKSLVQLHPDSSAGRVADAQPEEKAEPPRYFYPYSAKRDPFAPLIGGSGPAAPSTGSKGLSKGELTNLELKGIMTDRKGKVAFIATSDGETFVLKSGRIYDRKNRIVAGVSGIIKENSVVLISQNRTMTELGLRKKEEGTVTTKSQ